MKNLYYLKKVLFMQLNKIKAGKMYKLVNIKTGQETICNKIQIENFDYYVSGEK